MARQGRSGYVLELIVVATITATGLALLLTGLLPAGLRAENWLVPAVFLYVPVIASLIDSRDLTGAGLEGTHWKRAGIDAALYFLVVLPVFFGAWRLLGPFGIPIKISFHLPDNWTMLLLWHLLGVALPEEVFFRGWLQSRLDILVGWKKNLGGAQVGAGLFIAALAFAAVHYILEPRPDRLLVFFPALLFGYLRESSRSVFVPVLAHGAGNFFFLLFQVSARTM